MAAFFIFCVKKYRSWPLANVHIFVALREILAA